MKIKIATALESTKGINRRINPYTEKEQYNARDILAVLKGKLPPDAFCLIGVCMTDLYPR
jgi:archaemetzincin